MGELYPPYSRVEYNYFNLYDSVHMESKQIMRQDEAELLVLCRCRI